MMATFRDGAILSSLQQVINITNNKYSIPHDVRENVCGAYVCFVEEHVSKKWLFKYMLQPKQVHVSIYTYLQVYSDLRAHMNTNTHV